MAHNRLIFTFYMAASMAATQAFAQESYFIQGYAPQSGETASALEGIDEALDPRVQIGTPVYVPEKWLEPAWELDWVHVDLGNKGVVTPKAPKKSREEEQDNRSFEEKTADLFTHTFAALDYKTTTYLLPEPAGIGAISQLELDNRTFQGLAAPEPHPAVIYIADKNGEPDLQAMFRATLAAHEAQAKTANIPLPRRRPAIEDADIRLAKIYTALAINIVPLKILPAEMVSQQMNIAWLENNTPGTPVTRVAQFTLQNPGFTPIP